MPAARAAARSMSYVCEPSRWIIRRSLPARMMSASISPVRSVIRNSLPGSSARICSLDGVRTIVISSSAGAAANAACWCRSPRWVMKRVGCLVMGGPSVLRIPNLRTRFLVTGRQLLRSSFVLRHSLIRFPAISTVFISHSGEMAEIQGKQRVERRGLAELGQADLIQCGVDVLLLLRPEAERGDARRAGGVGRRRWRSARRRRPAPRRTAPRRSPCRRPGGDRIPAAASRGRSSAHRGAARCGSAPAGWGCARSRPAARRPTGCPPARSPPTRRAPGGDPPPPRTTTAPSSGVCGPSISVTTWLPAPKMGSTGRWPFIASRAEITGSILRMALSPRCGWLACAARPSVRTRTSQRPRCPRRKVRSVASARSTTSGRRPSRSTSERSAKPFGILLQGGAHDDQREIVEA